MTIPSHMRVEVAAMAMLLGFGIGLRLANLSIVTGRSPDETNYTRQANIVRQDGAAGLRGIAAEYQRDPAYRLAGPPTRAGYLWLLAAAMRLTGRTDESVGALVSCAASIGSLLLLALIGIRFFPPWATLFAVLFLAVSPAELELARRAWTDALVGFLGLALVYVAGEITRDSQRRLWHWIFVLLGGLGILVKEFGPVLFGLCAVWVLWVMAIQRREFRNGLALMAGVLVATLASVAGVANSLGGFSVLAQTVINWRAAHVSNDYAIQFQSGPGYLLLRAFQIISPASALFWIIGLAVMLLSRRRLGLLRLPAGVANWPVIGWMTLFSMVYLALAMILPHWLNLRYLSVLFGPFYLLAGVGFWYAASACWKRLGVFNRRRDRAAVQRHADSESSLPARTGGWDVGIAQFVFAGLVILGLGIGASSDYRRFDRMFVSNGVGDLSIKLVLDRASMFAAEKKVKRAPTAENYLNLCQLYDRNWRYADSLAACQKALQLRPEYAEAYNAMATAFNDQEMWDEAIQAAQQALRLKPDFPAARSTLEWSLNQKRLKESREPAK